jgi:hypothetical protein
LLLICKFENLLTQSFAARILSEEKGKMAGEASCLFSANTPPLSATPAGLLNTKIWIEGPGYFDSLHGCHTSATIRVVGAFRAEPFASASIHRDCNYNFEDRPLNRSAWLRLSHRQFVVSASDNPHSSITNCFCLVIRSRRRLCLTADSFSSFFSRPADSRTAFTSLTVLVPALDLALGVLLAAL